MSEPVKISRIRIDGGTQARTKISPDIVKEYASAIKEGASFPPVILFFDGANHWLADGFHRYHAHKEAGADDVIADVNTGTARDAILYSVGANGEHGLRRTNEDKRKAVLTLLSDVEWQKWSDREIARKCSVSDRLVNNIRGGLTANIRSEERNYITKHGTEAVMDATAIGEERRCKKPEQDEWDRQREEHKAQMPAFVAERQAAKAASKTKTGDARLSDAERIEALEAEVISLEEENARLKAENKKFEEMRVQFEKGGFEEVIRGKNAEISALKSRVERESKEKVANLNSLEWWKKQAIKHGWTDPNFIPVKGAAANG